MALNGGLACAELVDDATQRPDVRLECVLLSGADFGRHVKWCADIGGGEVMGLNHLGQAKVTKLDGVVLSKEHCSRLVYVTSIDGAMKHTILRLEIAMQNGHGSRGRLRLGSCAEETQHIAANLGRVDAIMASVERSNQLRENAPHK